MKLLTISGSLRKGSYNRMLLAEAARHFGDAVVVNADLRLSLYDGDLEEADGIPSNVQTLADQIADADAVVISSPEYNQAPSGVLKNALDWVSRVDGNPWADKPVVLVHAAAGRTGGARANYALRLMMAPFGADLIQGPEVLVAGAFKEFDDAGQMENAHYVKGLSALMTALRARV
jgi:chromate reductase